MVESQGTLMRSYMQQAASNASLARVRLRLQSAATRGDNPVAKSTRNKRRKHTAHAPASSHSAKAGTVVALPKATRRVSDAVLARALDEHMLDSMSDIADTYQRLSVQLGFKSMRFQEYVRVQSSQNVTDKAADLVSSIASWRKTCSSRGLDPRTVMLVVADGMSISGVMRALHLCRPCVRVQLRACLSVWSLFRKRCDAKEVARSIYAVSAHCPRAKQADAAKSL